MTVIVSARDAETTIAAAMRSALRSLPSSARMIVRSDGSTDGTLRAARSVDDRRVRVLEDDEWVGIPTSLNRLLEHVSTPLVTRLDSDDISLPGRFGPQLRRIAAGIDFSFTTSLFWRAGTPIIAPQKPYAVTAESSPFFLLLANPFIQSTMVARTEAISDLGGYRIVASEDFDLFVRAATKGFALERLRVPRLIYRLSPTQITKQASWWADQKSSPLVEQAFNDLSTHALGFVPSWFEWRRAQFPLESVPSGVDADIARFRSAIAGLRRSARMPLERRLAKMAKRAAEARR
ncbi:glycosyltransferase family 2 protein [Leifsonia sp. McL0607]|uniref:glycosyltransferase family 2 protein n=1 Tax=Leifsonia sp. McL0607 TaxID=3415672 RepID=UPI003CF030C0